MLTETGFPSPARGYEATSLDLNELLVRNPPATFYMRMQGTQLQYRGVLPDDLLVVDRSRSPAPGSLVVFRQTDEFTCRELIRDGDGYGFASDNGKTIPVGGETEIFGTVTAVVRKL